MTKGAEGFFFFFKHTEYKRKVRNNERKWETAAVALYVGIICIRINVKISFDCPLNFLSIPKDFSKNHPMTTVDSDSHLVE